MRVGPKSESLQSVETRILNGWKEISQHLGRGVRTVQRWESLYGMPVHRPANKDRSAVTAFASELDHWLKNASFTGAPYVRPTIAVMEQPREEAISNCKLVLEIKKFNVLTAFTAQEMRATAQKYNVDAFVVDLTLTDPELIKLGPELKQSYPQKPVIAMGDDPEESRDLIFIRHGDVEGLKNKLVELFGEPQIVPAA